MVLSKKVRVSPGGIHGHCWFAGEDIKAGELIWWQGEQQYNDIDVPTAELNTWPQDKREKWLSLAYMVGPDTYRGSDPDKEIPQDEINEYYVNHSCGGNCWYNGETELAAMTDIPAGAEICYDYALTECDPQWLLADRCLCGTSQCRQKVTGNDWQRTDLQQKYGRHFTTHILKLIDDHKAKHGEQRNGHSQ